MPSLGCVTAESEGACVCVDLGHSFTFPSSQHDDSEEGASVSGPDSAHINQHLSESERVKEVQMHCTNVQLTERQLCSVYTHASQSQGPICSPLNTCAPWDHSDTYLGLEQPSSSLCIIPSLSYLIYRWCGLCHLFLYGAAGKGGEVMSLTV